MEQVPLTELSGEPTAELGGAPAAPLSTLVLAPLFWCTWDGAVRAALMKVPPSVEDKGFDWPRRWQKKRQG